MRMFLRLVILLLIGTVACARPAPGTLRSPQDAAYARVPGDTLRYREQSEWVSSDGLAGGMHKSAPTRFRRDTRLAVTFADSGLARAWIESVQIRNPGRDDGFPREQTAGAEVVGLPFVLGVGPRGSYTVVSAPRFSGSWSGLRSQFNGFFPRLPGGALTMGRTWEDSGGREVVDSLTVTTYSHHIAYRVRGTGTIRGAPVVIVEYDAEFNSDSRPRNMDAFTQPYLHQFALGDAMRSEEHGTIYFAPGTGRLVRRTWTGDRTFSRPSGYVEAAVQEVTYRGTLELLSNPRR